MTTAIAIRNLTEGQLIDLGTIEPHLFLCVEGTCSDCDSVYVAMEFEYAVVENVQSAPGFLTRLATSQGVFDLPAGLLVEVLTSEESII